MTLEPDSPDTDSGGRPVIDPSVGQQLVLLRLLMQEAKDRTHDSSIAGRHIAVMQLQNVCELAIICGLGHFGISHSEQTRFNDLYSKLAEKVDDPAWARSNRWSQVVQMNKARNASHHHAIVPDHAALVSWGAEAERFVRSLVLRVFNVDVLAVVLSDMIESEDIRESFAEAERAVSEGSPVPAVAAAMTAFDRARQIWHMQRSSPATATSWPDMNKLIPRSYSDAIDSLTDADEVRAFASDMGTYAWVQEVARQAAQPEAWPDAITIEDARRVLSFVFGWILNWQAFSATFDIGRSRYLVANPAPPVSDSPHLGPRLMNTTLTAIVSIVSGAPIMTVMLPVVDAPSDGFSQWWADLHAQLQERQVDVLMGAAAVIEFSVPEDEVATFDPDGFLTAVSESLAIANAEHASRLAAVEAWHSDHAEAAEAYRSALLPLRFQHRAVFTDVELQPYGSLSADRPLPPFVIRAALSKDLLEIVNQFGLSRYIGTSIQVGIGTAELYDAEPALLVFNSIEPAEAVEAINQALAATVQEQAMDREAAARRQALAADLGRAMTTALQRRQEPA